MRARGRERKRERAPWMEREPVIASGDCVHNQRPQAILWEDWWHPLYWSVHLTPRCMYGCAHKQNMCAPARTHTHTHTHTHGHTRTHTDTHGHTNGHTDASVNVLALFLLFQCPCVVVHVHPFINSFNSFHPLLYLMRPYDMLMNWKGQSKQSSWGSINQSKWKCQLWYLKT